ncbi:MAG: MG2 domain-containing protein, partial [Calditrichia bacterium]
MNLCNITAPLSFQKIFRILLILLFFLLLTSCGKESRQEKKEITYPAETAQLVSQVPAGVLSPGSSIRVQFVEAVIREALVGKSLQNRFFSFEPDIAGSARWEDQRTVVFTPNQPLPMRRRFRGTLDLAGLLENDKLTLLDFSFEVAGREIAAFEGDFQPVKSGDQERLFYTGRVKFTQPTDVNEVKKAASLQKGKQNVSLVWDSGADSLSFTFRSDTLLRPQSEQQFEFSLKKDPLELSDDYRTTVSLKPLTQFSVEQISTLSTGKEPALQITFSHQLDASANPQGFIQIPGMDNLRLITSGKKITINGNFEYGRTYEVTVQSGLRSKWGTKLANVYRDSVQFADIKPQIRFDNEGLFLPRDNRQQIAFQAVNVRRVEAVIHKVFESNLGFFLQTARLGSENSRYSRSSYDLQRVGVEVARQDLDLGINRNQWQRFILDLQKLIPAGEKGLFIIRLEFTKEDMLYGPLEEEPDNGNRSYFRGEAYYEDPRSPGYLYRNGSISRPLIVSDIGLTVKKGFDEIRVFSTNIPDAEPMGGVEIRLRSYQNQVLASRTTGGEGTAVFRKPAEEVFWVEGEKAGQRSLIKLNEMAWNYSSFETGGAEIPEGGIRAFIYTERGVYRPGDTLHLSLVARNENGNFPDDHPVTLKIYNPLRQLVWEQTRREGQNGFYAFEFYTRPEDMTGTWQAELLVGSQTFHYPLKIETVVPHRLKIALNPRDQVIGP